LLPKLPARSEDAPQIEKYRPKSIADVVAHADIVDTSAAAAARWGGAQRAELGCSRQFLA
jgi:hypothetical protein